MRVPKQARRRPERSRPPCRTVTTRAYRRVGEPSRCYPGCPDPFRPMGLGPSLAQPEVLGESPSGLVRGFPVEDSDVKVATTRLPPSAGFPTVPTASSALAMASGHAVTEWSSKGHRRPRQDLLHPPGVTESSVRYRLASHHQGCRSDGGGSSDHRGWKDRAVRPERGAVSKGDGGPRAGLKAVHQSARSGHTGVTTRQMCVGDGCSPQDAVPIRPELRHRPSIASPSCRALPRLAQGPRATAAPGNERARCLG
jgi:hypothetical protein